MIGWTIVCAYVLSVCGMCSIQMCLNRSYLYAWGIMWIAVVGVDDAVI